MEERASLILKIVVKLQRIERNIRSLDISPALDDRGLVKEILMEHTNWPEAEEEEKPGPETRLTPDQRRHVGSLYRRIEFKVAIFEENLELLDEIVRLMEDVLGALESERRARQPSLFSRMNDYIDVYSGWKSALEKKARAYKDILESSGGGEDKVKEPEKADGDGINKN